MSARTVIFAVSGTVDRRTPAALGGAPGLTLCCGAILPTGEKAACLWRSAFDLAFRRQALAEGGCMDDHADVPRLYPAHPGYVLDTNVLDLSGMLLFETVPVILIDAAWVEPDVCTVHHRCHSHLIDLGHELPEQEGGN